MKDRNQLDLHLDSSLKPARGTRHIRRPNHARWWFSQMRAVVNQALDWEPAPPPQPEQPSLNLAQGRLR